MSLVPLRNKGCHWVVVTSVPVLCAMPIIILGQAKGQEPF